MSGLHHFFYSCVLWSFSSLYRNGTGNITEQCLLKKCVTRLDGYGLFSTIENWKPEIINSFNRPYDSRRQSNALIESYNQKLLDQKKSPISWIHTVFPSRYSRIFLLSKPRVILERQIAKTATDFT